MHDLIPPFRTGKRVRGFALRCRTLTPGPFPTMGKGNTGRAVGGVLSPSPPFQVERGNRRRTPGVITPNERTFALGEGFRSGRGGNNNRDSRLIRG